MLEVEDLWAGYGEVDVVHGVGMSVGRGDVVALIGPNGAGKTTFGKAVSGLLGVRRGRVRLDGADLTNQPIDRVRAAGLAFALEGRRLFANMTVEDNLLAGGHQLRGRAALKQACARAYATFPALADKRGQLAGSLSGGEAQMLALARSLMATPRALVLDEPTLGLAPRVVERVRTVIAEIAAAGVAVLLIEQNARLTQRVSSHTYVLRSGAVVLEDATASLSEERIHAAYMGESRTPA